MFPKDFYNHIELRLVDNYSSPSLIVINQTSQYVDAEEYFYSVSQRVLSGRNLYLFYPLPFIFTHFLPPCTI